MVNWKPSYIAVPHSKFTIIPLENPCSAHLWLSFLRAFASLLSGFVFLELIFNLVLMRANFLAILKVC